MPKTLRIRATVQPGGRVEFASPELEAGQTVEVVSRPRRQRRAAPPWTSWRMPRANACSRPRRKLTTTSGKRGSLGIADPA